MSTARSASPTIASPVIALALVACVQTHMGELDAGYRPDAAPDAASDASLDSGVDGGLDASLPDGGRPLDARVYAFCVELTELRCRGNETCCGDIADRSSLDWLTGCEASQVEEQCQRMARDTAVYDGTLRYDEVEARAMIDALTTALDTCAAIPRPFDLSPAFEGMLAEGEVCTPDLMYSQSIGRFRCRGDLSCAISDDDDEGRYTGVCTPRRGEGDSCNNNDCEVGLWCNSYLAGGRYPFIGRCTSGADTPRCTRDSWCRTRFCDRDIVPRACVEPEPAHTWCGYVGA